MTAIKKSSLLEEENPPEEVRKNLVLFDKSHKGYKKKDTICHSTIIYTTNLKLFFPFTLFFF